MKKCKKKKIVVMTTQEEEINDSKPENSLLVSLRACAVDRYVPSLWESKT